MRSFFASNIEQLKKKAFYFGPEMERLQEWHGDIKAESFAGKIDWNEIIFLKNIFDIVTIVSGMATRRNKIDPVYLCYDQDKFNALLSCCDISPLCAQYFIVFLVGDEVVNGFFSAPDTVLPTQLIVEEGDGVIPIIKECVDKRETLLQLVDRALFLHYTENENRIAQNIRDKKATVLICKMSVEAPRFRLLYEMMKNSLEKAGYQVYFNFEKSHIHRTDERIVICEKKPDLIFQINKSRDGRTWQGDRLHIAIPQLFFVNWLQDTHQDMLDHNYAKTMGERDYIFSIFTEKFLEKYQFNTDKIIPGGIMPASPDTFKGYTLTAAEHSHYDCDIAFVGTIMTVEQETNFIYSVLEPYVGEQILFAVFDKIIQMIQEIYDTNTGRYRAGDDILVNIIDQLQEQYTFDEVVRRNIHRVMNVIRYHSFRKLMMSQLVQENQYQIFLYGETDIKEAGITYKGFISNQEELSKALHCAKFVMQINPDATMNQRVLEAILSGTMVLVYNMEKEHDISPCYDYLEEGEGIRYFSTKKEMLDLLTYYVDNEPERLKVIEAGIKKIQEKLTPDQLAKNLVDQLSHKIYEKKR